MTDARADHGALRILVVNPDVPPKDRDSGSLRLFRIIEMMLEAGHSVSLLARDGLGERQEEAAEALLRIGVDPVMKFDLERAIAHTPDWHRARGIVPALDLVRIFGEGQFDVAWLSFFHIAEQYTDLIRTYSPATAIIVDSVDIHHVRETRGAMLANDSQGLIAAARTRERERLAYSAAHANVAVSEVDASHLRELAPDVPAHVVSNIHRLPELRSSVTGRSDVLFVGNFRHAPNVDAVLWFYTACWPQVLAEMPDAHLRIVGTEPPEVFTQIAGPNVTVEGWVPSIEPYLERARVSIAPLRFGAGVKGKIGEAMAAGVPVVTTSIGNEGMGMVHGEHALIADSPEEFATGVVTLLRDDALWERVSESGRSLLARTFDVESSRAAVTRLLRDVSPERWQAAADAPWLSDLLQAYADAHSSGDPALLVLTYPVQDPDAGDAALVRVTELAEQLGLDLEGMADIEIAGWHEAYVAPSRTLFWEPSRFDNPAAR